MAKRVTVQTELTIEELHDRYRSATNAVERTRLPYPVVDEETIPFRVLAMPLSRFQ